MPKIKKNAVVLTARDLLNGYVANKSDFNLYNMTPLQMVSLEEKDEEWKKWNMDWLERAGMRQLSDTAGKIRKNYALANGILDKSDYVIGADNDCGEHIAAIVNENENTIPLKFYPIIPQVVNVLTGEFSKRDSRIIVKAVDEFSTNEVLEEKRKAVQDILTKNYTQNKMRTLMEMGVDVNSEQGQQQFQQEMQAAQQLAEVETKFQSYRGVPEKWANHMIELDDQRFDMYQKEIEAFRDMLVCDREFWHVRVAEDDYSVELWNPKDVFYHKSPDTTYISEGNYVGRVRVMSISDVIDMFGDKMTSEQIESLKGGINAVTGLPLVDDAYRDRNDMYTDYSKPYPNSVTNVTMQKHNDSEFAKGNFNMSWSELGKLNTDYWAGLDQPGMLRVTEAYWKSQRKVFELTHKQLDPETGESILINSDTVDETYKATIKPIYDTSLHKVKNAKTLIHGEHLEPIWINEVRYGVKVNTTTAGLYSKNNYGFEPIYIGGDPIPFQFKGTNNLYGCKLPVEGRVFSERNSRSSSLVDKMKSYQILYNILNNQIVEMLADDPGNVIVLDQNMIPRNSMGGEWGKHNFAMFNQVMKDYNIAVVDPSVRNTEGATNFSHFQAVDLSKTNQLMARMKIAEWAKGQAFETVGIYPQRLGSVAASESATGVQQAVNNSYAQTEPYFDLHMNHLMPRVRQMMLDAAQFITATKPQARITYLNSNDENVFFQIEGYKLLLRDFQIYSRSTADVKATVEELKRVAMENNTAGGSLYEIASVLNMSSPSEIIAKLKEADAKRQQEQEAQREHEMQMQQQQQKFMDMQEEKNYKHKFEEEMLKAKTLIAVAQIRASQTKEPQDLNNDGIQDQLQALDFMEQQKVNAETMLRDRRKLDLEEQKVTLADDAQRRTEQLKREEMASKERIEKIKLKNPVSGEKKK